MPDDRELFDLARQVKNYLDYLGSLGVEHLPRVSATPAEPASPPPVESLEDVRTDLGDCRRCPLADGRTHLVFGEGSATADLMFIGEGPGQDEDLQGRPFVGRSGQLLTDIIVKGMHIRREDCYIANVVKCRPPGNRDPLPEEAGACLPFLHRQIRAIRPKVIVTLGRVATQHLLRTDAPMAALRGRFHDLNGIPVMPTYHPSFLLRQPDKKRDVWEDIKQVMARLQATGRDEASDD